jgi:hypothetical protein
MENKLAIDIGNSGGVSISTAFQAIEHFILSVRLKPDTCVVQFLAGHSARYPEKIREKLHRTESTNIRRRG